TRDPDLEPRRHGLRLRLVVRRQRGDEALEMRHPEFPVRGVQRRDTRVQRRAESLEASQGRRRELDEQAVGAEALLVLGRLTDRGDSRDRASGAGAKADAGLIQRLLARRALEFDQDLPGLNAGRRTSGRDLLLAAGEPISRSLRA